MDGRSDGYGLGVVLYELLTGERPYVAAGNAEVMRAILEAPVVPVRERRPDVPAVLAAIVERALQKDPDARFAGCRQMQEALEAWLHGTGEKTNTWALSEWLSAWAAPTDESNEDVTADVTPGPTAPSAPLRAEALPATRVEQDTGAGRLRGAGRGKLVGVLLGVLGLAGLGLTPGWLGREAASRGQAHAPAVYGAGARQSNVLAGNETRPVGAEEHPGGAPGASGGSVDAGGVRVTGGAGPPRVERRQVKGSPGTPPGTNGLQAVVTVPAGVPEVKGAISVGDRVPSASAAEGERSREAGEAASRGAEVVAAGRSAEAVREFRRCTQLSPRQPDCHRALGAAHVRLGQMDEARQAFRAYLELEPTGPQAVRVRAVLAALESGR